MTFEKFLQEKHADQYEGLDDEMPDDFNNWLCEMDVDNWIVLGDLYGCDRAMEAIDNIEKILMGNNQ